MAVEGTVSYDGKPVEEGTISFAPADGQGPTAGGPIQNGKYHLAGESGVAPGKKIVRITAVRKTGRQVEAGPPQPPGTMVDEVEFYIPDIYNTKSTLTCEITPGAVNQHHFELKPPAQ